MTRDEMIAAGQWLDRTRQERGLSVRQFATALDVSTQVVYKWQKGDNAVSDESAAKIAQVFRMPEIDVRRHLGLWVPDSERRAPDTELTIEEWRHKFASDPHLSPELKESIDALLRLEEKAQGREQGRREHDKDEGEDRRHTA